MLNLVRSSVAPLIAIGSGIFGQYEGLSGDLDDIKIRLMVAPTSDMKSQKRCKRSSAAFDRKAASSSSDVR
jgi:hypothetical protein